MMPKFDAVKKGGYNQKQVDDYIDRLRDEYSKAVNMNNKLKDRVNELETLEREKHSIATAMITTQALIETIEQDAKIRAKTIVREAAEQAKALTEKTQAQANKTLTFANKRAEQITKNAAQVQLQIRRDIENISQALTSLLKGEEEVDNYDETTNASNIS